MRREKILKFVKKKIARYLDIPIENVDEKENISNYNLHCILILDIIQKLVKKPDTKEIYKCKTINDLVDYIISEGVSK